jgi:hypothetical protein
MSPQRSVVPDPELCQGWDGEPARVPLASFSKFDDPQRDSFGYLISRPRGKLKLGARGVECFVHGFNMLRLESESTGSGPGHRGATNVLSGFAPDQLYATAGCRQMCDKHEELKNAEGRRTKLGCLPHRANLARGAAICRSPERRASPIFLLTLRIARRFLGGPTRREQER